ncbi:MAG: AraC family transcriptional regulator [Clostridia bacterium]|nr:AraC family transcriptional regulator [Clostridia bacterium]
MRPLYENRQSDFYFRDNAKSPLQCNAHLHYHLELLCLLGGSTRAFVDSCEYQLEAGDIFLIFPNQIHRFESCEKEDYLLFIINPDMMPELCRLFTTALPLSGVVRGAAKDPQLLGLLRGLSQMHTQENHPYYDVILKGQMLSFFGELLCRMELTKPRDGDSQSLKAVVRYCSQNFTKELSLEILERELHISKYYISHLFSHKLNMRFNDYINSLRISDACRYLRHDSRSVTEISELVGFSTLRTFNRAFIKQMGMTPSQYRKSNASPYGSVSIPR